MFIAGKEVTRKKIKDKVKSETTKFKDEVKKEVFLNVPNTITLARLVLVFVFIYMLFSGYSTLSLVIVYGVAAASDWFDGFFARRLKQTTKVGARLDQIIDRVFTGLVVLALFLSIYDGNLRNESVMLLLLSISREIVGTPGFVIRLIRNKDPYLVRYIGKVTTFVQSITIGLIILDVSWVKYPVFLTCIIGIVAGIDYLRDSLS